MFKLPFSKDSSCSVGIATHVLYLEMTIEQHLQNFSCRCVVSADQSYVWEPEILRRQKKGSTLWTLWTLWGWLGGQWGSVLDLIRC